MRSRSVSVQVQVTNESSHLKGLLESAQHALQARGGGGGHTASHMLPQMERKTLIQQTLLNDSPRYALNAQVPKSLVLASPKSPCSLSFGPLSPHWMHRIYYCEDLRQQNRGHGACMRSDQVPRSHTEAARTGVQTPAP